MQETPDAVLFHAALSYAATVSDQGDPRLGSAIGLRNDQLAVLRDLSARALMKMAARSAGCVQIEIDSDVFDELLREVAAELSHDQLIEDFILHDAPRDMMADLFDMSRREYTRLRRLLDMDQTVGRARKLTEEEQVAIHTVWLARGGHPEPADYLAIARKLDIPLRTLWDDELAKNAVVDLS